MMELANKLTHLIGTNFIVNLVRIIGTITVIFLEISCHQ